MSKSVLNPEQLRQIVDGLPNIVFSWQPEKGLEYINSAVEVFLGYSPTELQEDSELFLHLVHSADEDKVRKIIADLISGPPKTSESFVVCFRHKKGPFIWLRMQISSIAPTATASPTLVGVAHEITNEITNQKISETLREISAVLVSSLELDQTLTIILESLEKLLKFDSTAIYLLTPNNRLKMVGGRGMPYIEITMASATEIDRFPLDEAVLSNKKPLAITDVRQDKRWTPLKGTEYIRSWLGVPLLFRNKPIGLVTIDRATIDPFTTDQIVLTEAFAGHAAIALQNAELFSQVQSQQKRLRKLSTRIVAAQEEERRRISRELHDEMGQALTALKLNLQMLLVTLPAKETLVERLNELIVLSNDALQEVRRLSMDLRPAILDDLGLAPTLNWYQTQFKKRSNTKITLSITPNLPRLSPETETVLYRIVQEALTNVSRHSEANNVEISLSMDNKAIHFSIIDDGKGFLIDADNRVDTMGVGLIGMFERVEDINGTLEISSSQGEGTCIFIAIPITVALNSPPL